MYVELTLKLVADRPTDRPTDRQTNRLTDRQTDQPTDIVMYRVAIVANNKCCNLSNLKLKQMVTLIKICCINRTVG